MPSIIGGEDDESSLAPVIPLFGGGAPARPETRVQRVPVARDEQPLEGAELPWHASWVAPATRPAAGGSVVGGPAAVGGRAGRRVSFHEDEDDADTEHIDAGEVRDAAEASLLRKLRTRQLSVSESRGVLIAAGMESVAADDLLAQFERLGYLDDTGLARQLVRAAVERKGQGRQAISPLLTRRGIPRDVVDAVLSELPDDDVERALDFARTKARSLGASDRETALRRLLGQLARRGYPSSVSMTAARQALDEL